MNSDLRIQMEGGVERVALVVHGWASAAAALTAGQWGNPGRLAQLLREDLRLESDLSALKRRQEQSGDARVMLRRLATTRGRVTALLTARLRELGVVHLPTTLPELIAEERLHHPIVLEERIGWSTWLRSIYLVLGVAGAALGLALRQPAGPILIVVALVNLAALWFRSTRVLLTQRALVLNSRAAPLSEILAVNVRLASLTNRQGVRAELLVTLRGAPAWRIKSGGDPSRLLKELKARGVSVFVEDVFFLW